MTKYRCKTRDEIILSGMLALLRQKLEVDKEIFKCQQKMIQEKIKAARRTDDKSANEVKP